VSAQKLGQTPSQTVGPYFAYGLSPEQYGYAMTSIAGASLVDETVPGERITIEGRVIDGAGDAVRDALIEIWQADAEGHYQRPAGTNSRFTGFGRCGTGTDPDARFRFETVRPGAPRDGSPAGAPHINIILMMRGLLLHAFTRMYFPEDAALHASDEVLLAVPDDRRHTLIAEKISAGLYRFDIHMQGEKETVFFDI